MPDDNFPDEWLASSLEGTLTPEALTELRAKAQPGRTLWESVVAAKIATDEQILTALATRFRLKLADISQVDPHIRDSVPENLVRRFTCCRSG